MTENYEANVLVSNDTANALLIYFDELFAESRAQEITDDWLQHYRAVWKERRESEKKWRRDRERVQRLNLKFLDKKAPLRGVEGLAFCFTGRIEGWHREQRVYPAVRALHGRIVTRARDIRSANYLVHGGILGGEKTTRKLAEARRNNIPIIGVDQFLQALYREAKRQRRPGIVRREGRWIIPAWPAFTPVP